MPILPLTEENFEQEALQAEGPVLVDLFAAWCGPCRALAPVLETLAEARPEPVSYTHLTLPTNSRV